MSMPGSRFQGGPFISAVRFAIILCVSVFFRLRLPIGAPANCRTMTMLMSRGSTWTRPASASRRSRDEQFIHLRASDRLDADGHADLHRARHDGSDVHLHDDERSDLIRGA